MDINHFSQLAMVTSLGFVIGAGASWLFHRYKVGGYKHLGAEILKRAEQDAETARKESELAIRQAELEHSKELEKALHLEKRKFQREQERLALREDKLESRMNLIDKKLSDVEKREDSLAEEKRLLERNKDEVTSLKARLTSELEAVAKLTQQEAKAILLDKISHEVKADAAQLTRRIITDAEEQAESKARRIIATAIERITVSHISDIAVTTVPLPNEEMKARIIGREGRNIRALEQATGVSFIVDDTPDAIVLSGFDPLRRHIAKSALSELILDGRIHPTRIEEVVARTTRNAEEQSKQCGEDAALRAGVFDLHPELLKILGRLKFRYSFGQNALDHSLEVSYLLGLMAHELGLNIPLAKKIGLLHDIGKALSHEVEGSHAVIGHDLVIKYGESEEVANGIGCHHNEVDPITVEGGLCSAADALSASRPGARIEAVGEYIKRLRKLEDIAMTFPGIDKVYTIQAGKEIRIIVLPDMIDDEGVINLARDITKKIQKQLSYTHKIKVTVIREKRVVEYAL